MKRKVTKVNQYISREMYNVWQGFKPKSLNKKGTLDLFEIIDERTTDKVKAAVDSNPDNLHIRIHSPGGYVYSCIAINNMLRDYKSAGGKLTTEVVGLAASCAGNIALMGEKRIGHEDSMFMLHEVWIPNAENKRGLRKLADQAEEMDKRFMKNLFLKTLTADEDTIESYLQENEVMTTEQMKAFGVFTEYKSETDRDDEENEPSSEEEEEEKKSEPESETDRDDDDEDEGMSSHERKLLNELRRKT